MFSIIKKLLGSGTNIKEVLNEGAVIVDVRTAEEYRQGHITGSKNIPLDAIPKHIGTIKKYNKPVVTVCRSGARSAVAKNLLEKEGLRVYNGGSWVSLNNKLKD
jgi:phage shock protein E